MSRLTRSVRVGAAIAGAVALAITTASCKGVTAPKATQIVYNAGTSQTAPAGSILPINPSVQVLDQQFAPVQGVEVVYSVTGGGGSITGANAVSDASGVAAVGSWTLGPTKGPNQLTVTAQGLAGSGLTFDATGN